MTMLIQTLVYESLTTDNNNISWRFAWNSKANASEFLENLKKCFFGITTCVVMYAPSSFVLYCHSRNVSYKQPNWSVTDTALLNLLFYYKLGI